jgi:aconitate hydratase 2/2-methylisocitrate dehydratase
MLEAYRANVAERDLQGISPKPLDPWSAGLAGLLKDSPDDEEDFLTELIANRILPKVDEAAYRERF